MAEIEQCTLFVAVGGEFMVKHHRGCASEYCTGDWLAERSNRAMRHRAEMDLEK